MQQAGSGASPSIINFTQSCTASGGIASFSCSKVIYGASLSVRLTDANGNDVWVDGFGASTNAKSFETPPQPDGSYTLTADNGEAITQRQIAFACGVGGSSGGTGGGSGDGGATPVPGCTNPDAENYDGTATQDDGSCVVLPALALANALPDLAPNGVPLLLTLASAVMPAYCPAPAKAECVIDLSALAGAVGVVLTVNGYRLTSAAAADYQLFSDAESLTELLLALPALTGTYVIEQASATEVRLTARLEGTAYSLLVTTSDATKVAVTTTPGQARYRSQRRADWSCWVEVYVYPGLAYGVAPAAGAEAIRAQRLELPYRDSNAYVFDLAPVLSQYTAHAYPGADGSCPDRLAGYYLQFGESWADVAGGRRRVRTRYTAPGPYWTLEAVELVPEPTDGLRLLSRNPSPGRLNLLARPTVAATLSAEYHRLNYQGAEGRTTQSLTSLAGVVGSLALGSWPVLGNLPLPHLEHYLRLRPQGQQDIDVRVSAPAAGAQGLTFVNRQGGCETEFFAGLPQDSLKRTASTYQNEAGTQHLVAEATVPVRLTSGLLSYAVWDWLRRELAVTPAAWLETAAGPVAVRVTDLDATADPVKEEYSIAVELETPGPVRGLSN